MHVEFQNHREYLGAKLMYEANTNASDAYRKANKTNGIPSEICATFPYAKEVTNFARLLKRMNFYKLHRKSMLFM